MLLIVLTLASATELRGGVTPVQKVIQLLQGMAAKGMAEKQEEATKFAAFKQFCDDTVVEKQRRLREANQMIERLQADIQKAISDSSQIAARIEELNELIAEFQADKEASIKLREKEHAEYKKTHLDYVESVDSLARAIQTMRSMNMSPTAALLQVQKMARVPEKVKRTIASFLATDAEVIENLAQPMDPLAVSAPQANAFDFQSGGVVEMLEKLEDKFKDERNELEKAEMEAKHAHEMVVQDLDGQIKAATRELGRQESSKAQRDQDAAEAKGDLADTTATRDEDERYLAQLNAECGQKSTDFASRQQLRSEELEAIAKAIEILQSGSVTGNAEKYLPNLVQTAKTVSLAYLRTAPDKGAEVLAAQRGAANFLQSRAAQIQSRILELVADKVETDPFVKVRKMIKDLIVRLMEEASEEADHKSWCDSELTTNKQTRDTKTADVESLTSQRDGLTADIGKLSMEIQELAAAIAALDASVSEATTQRQSESASNKQTAEDAQEAQTAVAQALSVLKDFYDRAAEATALIQKKPDLGAPDTFSAPYTGMGGESGGVIGMLEVIQADFARLEAETESSEQEAAKAFDRFSAESAQDKAVKSTQLDHRDKTRTKKKGDLQDTSKDLKATQGELDAALVYYDKLKPSCVDAGVSYSDRVQRRQQEIESLQEALRILDGEDIA
jgi:uncharacterized protein YoxC